MFHSIPRTFVAAALVLAISAARMSGAAAAPKAPLKFWNLAAATITQLYVAPAGTQQWSANLCLADPDHAVDPDERLAMSGIAGGLYDVRVVDTNKRQCVFHGVAIKTSGPYAFSVSEDQMKGCSAR